MITLEQIELIVSGKAWSSDEEEQFRVHNLYREAQKQVVASIGPHQTLYRAMLDNQDAAEAKWQGVRFRSCNLEGINLGGANLTGATFMDCNLSNASLNKADLTGAIFSYCNLRGASMFEAKARRIRFSNSELVGLFARGIHAPGAYIRDCNLAYAVFLEADLTEADLLGSILRRTQLMESKLTGARFPSVPAMLEADWGVLSDELTTRMMAYDAFFHPTPSAFDRWAEREYGDCPYALPWCDVGRAAQFRELHEAWDPEASIGESGYALLMDVLAETTDDWKPDTPADHLDELDEDEDIELIELIELPNPNRIGL